MSLCRFWSVLRVIVSYEMCAHHRKNCLYLWCCSWATCPWHSASLISYIKSLSPMHCRFTAVHLFQLWMHFPSESTEILLGNGTGYWNLAAKPEPAVWAGPPLLFEAPRSCVWQASSPRIPTDGCIHGIHGSHHLNTSGNLTSENGWERAALSADLCALSVSYSNTWHPFLTPNLSY